MTSDAVDATLVGNTCDVDAVTAGDQCTLRAAIQQANSDTDFDTINILAGKFKLKLKGFGEDAAATGDLDITEDVEIHGVGPVSDTTIMGSGDRIFHVLNSASALITNLTITKGKHSTLGGGLWIEAFATLDLGRTWITKNSAGSGGGIFNEGTLTVRTSTISKNKAETQGGGITSYGSFSAATIVNSTLSGNSAKFLGGGLVQGAFGTSTLIHVTIAFNKTKTVGGAALAVSSNSTVAITNSIIALNKGGDCIAGSPSTFSKIGNNLDSDGSCVIGPPGMSGVDPLLEKLDENLPICICPAGPAPTHALEPGSPAIDAADAPVAEDFDQRGQTRPLNGDGLGGAEDDIGAFELEPPP